MITPRAPSTEAPSSSGLEMALRAASIERFSPSATPVPIIAMPMPAMIVFTSAKSRLIIPGTRIRSEMPWIACRSTSSAVMNASLSVVCRSMIESSRSLGIVMTVSTHSRSASSPASACTCRRRALELERLGDDGDRQRAELRREAGDDGRRARAGAAAEPCGDEHHVGAVERLNQLVGVLERRLAAHVRVRARAEALGELPADLDLHGRGVHLQRLQVGVRDDELDALEAALHHARDGVAAAAADAHHLDARACAAILIEPQPQLA